MLTIAVRAGEQDFVLHEIKPREHGQLLLPWIEALFEQAGMTASDLDAIFVGHGPGGFTGVRIGVCAAQGIAAACDIPVVGVSSLQVMAQHLIDVQNAEQIIVAQDARMREVYWAAYVADENGLAKSVVNDQLCHPNHVDRPSNANKKWFAIGDAWQVYPNELQHCCGHLELEIKKDCYPHASAVMKLGVESFNAGLTINPENLLPVYLRGASAWSKDD